jgi:flagellar hook-basal body complex protein FliE
MIEGIQNGSALARAALEAAQRTQQAAARVDGFMTDGAGAAPGAARFEGQLSDAVRGAVRAVDAELQGAQRLPMDLLAGEVTDFHAVAAQIKRAELTFKFALEVRNKLIEAYRETMRMSV